MSESNHLVDSLDSSSTSALTSPFSTMNPPCATMRKGWNFEARDQRGKAAAGMAMPHVPVAPDSAHHGRLYRVQPPHARRYKRSLPRSKPTLHDLLADKCNVLGTDAQRRIRRAIRLFESVNGVVPAADIRQNHIEAFVLREFASGTGQSTIEGHVYSLSLLTRRASLANAACAEWLRILRTRFEASRSGQNLREDELGQLLGAPAFRAARAERSAARAARFWLPLVALTIGRTGSELVHAKVADIERHVNSWTLTLTQERARSPRTQKVTISAPLINCGFLAYAAQRKLDGHTYLFASDAELWPPTAVLASVNRWLANLTRPLRLPARTLAALRQTFISESIEHSILGLAALSRSSESNRQLLALLEQDELPATNWRPPSLLQLNAQRLSHLYVTDPLYLVDKAFPSAMSKPAVEDAR